MYNLPDLIMSGNKFTNNDNNKQFICLPSSSASADKIILSYLDFVASQAVPIPAPIAFAMSQTSLFFYASLMERFVTFLILPLKGKTA